MKKITFIILMVFAGMASAETFICNNRIFTSSERSGVSMEEVFKECGNPISQTFNHWVYIKDNTRYVLTFGGDGLLTNITGVGIFY
jgi:hypothetical protein